MTKYQLHNDPRTYLYQKMAEHLAQRITAGDLAPNTPLPAERRLAEDYGVSIGTARHAMRVLRSRGLVVTLRCKGTFIAKREAWTSRGETADDRVGQKAAPRRQDRAVADETQEAIIGRHPGFPRTVGFERLQR